MRVLCFLLLLSCLYTVRAAYGVSKRNLLQVASRFLRDPSGLNIDEILFNMNEASEEKILKKVIHPHGFRLIQVQPELLEKMANAEKLEAHLYTFLDSSAGIFILENGRWSSYRNNQRGGFSYHQASQSRQITRQTASDALFKYFSKISRRGQSRIYRVVEPIPSEDMYFAGKHINLQSGLASVNNLIGKPEFDEEFFFDVCKNLKEASKEKKSFCDEREEIGNYDLEVLKHAFHVNNFDLVQVHANVDNKVLESIITVQDRFLLRTRRHWYSLRRNGSDFQYLDSLKTKVGSIFTSKQIQRQLSRLLRWKKGQVYYLVQEIRKRKKQDKESSSSEDESVDKATATLKKDAASSEEEDDDDDEEEEEEESPDQKEDSSEEIKPQQKRKKRKPLPLTATATMPKTKHKPKAPTKEDSDVKETQDEDDEEANESRTEESEDQERSSESEEDLQVAQNVNRNKRKERWGGEKDAKDAASFDPEKPHRQRRRVIPKTIISYQGKGVQATRKEQLVQRGPRETLNPAKATHADKKGQQRAKTQAKAIEDEEEEPVEEEKFDIFSWISTTFWEIVNWIRARVASLSF